MKYFFTTKREKEGDDKIFIFLSVFQGPSAVDNRQSKGIIISDNHL